MNNIIWCLAETRNLSTGEEEFRYRRYVDWIGKLNRLIDDNRSLRFGPAERLPPWGVVTEAQKRKAL